MGLLIKVLLRQTQETKAHFQMTTTPNPNLNVRAALLARWKRTPEHDYFCRSLSGLTFGQDVKREMWTRDGRLECQENFKFDSDLTAIHAEVQRMTPEQRVKFQLALDDSADAKNCQPCELDAATWTECFVSVMEGEKALREFEQKRKEP